MLTSERIYKRALDRALDAGIAYREAEAIARDEAEEWSSRRVDEVERAFNKYWQERVDFLRAICAQNCVVPPLVFSDGERNAAWDAWHTATRVAHARQQTAREPLPEPPEAK